MAYKTILAHWADANAPKTSAGLGAAMAKRFEGHLTLIAFGIEPNIAAYSYGAPGAAVISAQTEAARDQAETLHEAAQAWHENQAVNADARPALSPIPRPAPTPYSHSRYADLVVVEQPYDSPREDIAVRVTEGALFEGSAPVLICPQTAPATVGTKVIVAWDRSVEALHAIRGAMPFLKAAEKVELTLVDPMPAEAGGEEDPGADMALTLSRHGVNVEVAQIPSVGHTVGEVLRHRVTDIGADLLVMGAYGHSRLRESLIGGPTRAMLEAAPVPVLMAH